MTAIIATETGTYYCNVNDADSCDLTSNSIILSQYSTPSLEAGGDVVICDGDSLTLTVVSNAGSEIEWLPPLSGNGLTQVVTQPGVYTCKITSCGIETYASIEVQSHPGSPWHPRRRQLIPLRHHRRWLAAL